MLGEGAHAAGDGTTGMLIMGSIMEQYQALLEAKEMVLKPRIPKDCVETLTNVSTKVTTKVEQLMLDKKVDRALNYTPFLPFNIKELEEVRRKELPLNMTLFKEGKEENYSMVKGRCRKEG